MLFRNFTPFSPLYFESRDEKQNDFGVVVLRGTFKIEDGKPLRMQQDQEPILFKDEYFGDPQESSLKFDTSMAPFKPKTDILVNANAYSPSWKPEKYWDVLVRFGSRAKQLTVTGARQWNRQMGGYDLSRITPADSVPLRYELAFGGSYSDEHGERQFWPENPVGRGIYDRNNPQPVIAAPQIFADQQAAGLLTLGKACITEGFGAIAPHWAPRSERVGTYNEMWKRTRFPDLPADFDFRFYNSASRGFTLDGFAKGDEAVELINLTPSRKTTFQLPNYQLGSLMRFETGELLPGPVLLDTVHIDTFDERVYLTWRTVYPIGVPLRALEIRAKDVSGTISKQTTQPSAFDDDDIYYPEYI